ncbi:MAG: uridine phosphorylase [Gaiellaceae bacterium]
MRVQDQAWYLRATPSQVADRALLVGDRGRIARIAARLDEPTFLNDDRGLWTVSGRYEGTPVTAAAFGMGAPIAAVVLHELWSIGTSTFLRLGTAMRLPPGKLGEFLLGEAAIRGESTSGTYVPEGYPAVSDYTLQTIVRRELAAGGESWQAGVFASYDGFYTQMLALRECDRAPIAARVEELCSLGVLAIDMETSAVLAVASALGARASSLCLATVAWEGGRKMDDEERARAEDRLVELGLASLKALGEAPAGGELDRMQTKETR